MCLGPGGTLFYSDVKLPIINIIKNLCQFKIRNLTFGHLMLSRSKTIWLKFYLGTHKYILLICAKNQDFMLRLKLSLGPIKTLIRHLFHIFHILCPVT